MRSWSPWEPAFSMPRPGVGPAHCQNTVLATGANGTLKIESYLFDLNLPLWSGCSTHSTELFKEEELRKP